MGSYTFNFPIQAGDPSPLTRIAEAVRQVAERTRASAGEMRLFESVLKSGMASGLNFDKAIRQISESTNTFTPNIRKAALALLEQKVAHDAAAQAVGRHASALERLSGRIGGRIGGGVLGSAIGFPGLGMVGGIGGGALGGAGLALGAAGLGIAGVINATKQARDLEDLAHAMGISAVQANRFAIAAEIAGVKSATLASAAEQLSRALEEPATSGKKAVDAMTQLGVAFTDSAGKLRAPGEILKDTLAALQKIPDAAKQNQLGLDALGGSWREVYKVVKDYSDLTKTAGKISLVNDEDVKRLDAAAKSLSMIWEYTKQISMKTAAFMLSGGYEQFQAISSYGIAGGLNPNRSPYIEIPGPFWGNLPAPPQVLLAD